jgi:hypothetical protein
MSPTIVIQRKLSVSFVLRFHSAPIELVYGFVIILVMLVMAVRKIPVQQQKSNLSGA